MQPVKQQSDALDIAITADQQQVVAQELSQAQLQLIGGGQGVPSFY
jgi:hypothetical protein